MTERTPILITGLKHSGKSTAARKAAEVLNADFLDMDEIIEKLHLNEEGIKLSARAIYRKGRDIFQKYESAAAEFLARRSGGFIAAAGGGVCDNDDACRRMKEFIWIYLEEKPELLFDRIKKGGIPAFLTSKDPYNEFINLCNMRSARYDELCDIKIIAGGRSPAEIYSEITKKILEDGNGWK